MLLPCWPLLLRTRREWANVSSTSTTRPPYAPRVSTAGSYTFPPKQPKDPAGTKEALKFFEWAYKNGDDMASALDYIPMPDNVVDLIATKWKSDIKDDSGKPVY